MATVGRRYPLIMYTHMLNRWWPATSFLGAALLVLAWSVYSRGREDWRWLTLASVGGFDLLFSVFLFTIRKSAYVQLFTDHLRLVTPFLRINISYKRLRRTSSATMGGLFPPKSISHWRQGILEPLAKMTAVVVELNGYPITQTVLKFFFSPFFFKDKTPHFVILVQDWMRFSSDLESLRAGGGVPAPRQKTRDQSILSRLPHK
ncbi:MAG: hypothetical protein HZB19_06625 [Chloroflexi bacterium]|nr:hypothetical protein [Chloroflexota bacterium]